MSSHRGGPACQLYDLGAGASTAAIRGRRSTAAGHVWETWLAACLSPNAFRKASTLRHRTRGPWGGACLPIPRGAWPCPSCPKPHNAPKYVRKVEANGPGERVIFLGGNAQAVEMELYMCGVLQQGTWNQILAGHSLRRAPLCLHAWQLGCGFIDVRGTSPTQEEKTSALPPPPPLAFKPTAQL